MAARHVAAPRDRCVLCGAETLAEICHILEEERMFLSDAAKAMLLELARQIHLLYTRSSIWELAQVPVATEWKISPKMHFFTDLMKWQVMEFSHKQATKIPARSSPSRTVRLLAKEMLNLCRRRPGNLEPAQPYL